MKPLCIYHGHCDDGFGAAWAVRAATGKLFEFHAGQYQTPPPDVTGRHVLLVDFSYKRPVLLEMAAKAKSIVILDHHKTSAEDLSGFRAPSPFAEWKDHERPTVEGDAEPIAALFDMNRSGAGLAWDFFHAGKPRPRFIDYIEDRDLWRKSLPDGDAFTFALRSYPPDFDLWDKLAEDVDGLIRQGAAIHRFFRCQVEDQKKNSQPALIGGVPCRVVNTPYTFASEVAGEIIEEPAKFGACYFQFASGEWGYSLRSRGDFDVSAIAKTFGGGGHKNAAGFKAAAPVHERV